MTAGYASPAYALALAEFGEPLALPRSGGSLLTAAVRDSGYRDAFGPYPLFSAEHPEGLAEDLEQLKDRYVSVYVVSDPLRERQTPYFEAAFDFVRDYKPHYIVDLDIGFERYLKRHHRRYAKRAFEQIEVEQAADPAMHVAEWSWFYEGLCERHGISGLRRFSALSFAGQMRVPGCHYFRALHHGKAVGGFMCYLDRHRAYAHLIATTPQGQDLLAQYALYWSAIEFFRGTAGLFDLGGVPGGMDATAGGLAFFKAGWSTSVRQSRFCGRILNRAAYDKLCAGHSGGGSGHFPAYRAGILGAA
jgi:hypothetical protein